MDTGTKRLIKIIWLVILSLAHICIKNSQQWSSKWSSASAANSMFEFAAPRQWNSLPATLRTSGSLHTFKKGLKTYLFPH